MTAAVKESLEHQRRRCVGCMQRAGKAELLRLVWDGARVALDSAQTRGGRGAYLHKAAACAARACEPKRWEHAFRLAAGSVRPEAVAAVRELAAAPREREALRGRKVRL